MLTINICICIIADVRFLGDIMLIDLSEILSTEGLTKSVEVHVDFDSFQFKGRTTGLDRQMIFN